MGRRGEALSLPSSLRGGYAKAFNRRFQPTSAADAVPNHTAPQQRNDPAAVRSHHQRAVEDENEAPATPTPTLARGALADPKPP